MQLACNAKSIPRRTTSVVENALLRANIFYKPLVHIAKKNNSKVYVVANKIVCLWSDSNTES
jgi:hypothetical protein